MEWIIDGSGNVYFTVTSNGMTPEQWEQHFECRGQPISNSTRDILPYINDAPTKGVIYNIVIRSGRTIDDYSRITKRIRKAAEKCGWQKPHWEVAFLILDTLTEEQLKKMGLLYIVTMHEPIKSPDGNPCLLLAILCREKYRC